MATRLINAIGKGLGQTVKGAAKSAASRATRDIPDTKSFYNLGMGVGPFIRNTVQSYQKDSSSNTNDTKKITASLGFAKENVVTQKNIAGQLSALTSIMSDIRKISLAQLNLQRASMPKGSKGFGDRSGYLSLEQKLEGGEGGGRASLSGTQSNPEKGGNKLMGSLLSFMGNNSLISAGLLGILALANAKHIGQFLEDSGIKQALKDGTKAAVSGIATLISDTIKAGIMEGLPKLYKGMKEDLKKAKIAYDKGDMAGVTTNVTNAAKPVGAFAGMVAGFRYTPGGLLGKTVGATLGGIAGYTGVELGGEELAKLQTLAAAGDKQAIAQLKELELNARKAGVGVGAAASAYGISKVIKNAKTAAVTPTATPGAAGTPSSAPPSAKVPQGKLLTDYGSVGENREMAKNKTVLEKSKANFSKTLQLLRKLIAKMGMQRVGAYIAARFAAAAALGATGFLGGPLGFITTALTIGLTIYELYSLLEDLDKETENSGSKSKGDASSRNPSGNANSTSPGSTPAQTPAGSPPKTNPPGAGNTNGNTNDASGYANPAPGSTVSGLFGDPRPKEGGGTRPHEGIDLAGELGSPIAAAMDGTVIRAEQGVKGYGQLITIQHADGTITKYGHLSKMFVQKGDTVKKGQTIAGMGSTGTSSGPHLHFEVVPKGSTTGIDPLGKLPGIKGEKGSRTPGSSTNMGDLSGSGDQAKAPGKNTPSDKFASVFGFDPSKLGVDLSKELSGDELAQLNSLYNDVTGVQNVMGDAVKEINKTQQLSNNRTSAPAPVQTAGSTQSAQKDFLWHHHNPAPQLYHAA